MRKSRYLMADPRGHKNRPNYHRNCYMNSIPSINYGFLNSMSFSMTFSEDLITAERFSKSLRKLIEFDELVETEKRQFSRTIKAITINNSPLQFYSVKEALLMNEK